MLFLSSSPGARRPIFELSIRQAAKEPPAMKKFSWPNHLLTGITSGFQMARPKMATFMMTCKVGRKIRGGCFEQSVRLVEDLSKYICVKHPRYHSEQRNYRSGKGDGKKKGTWRVAARIPPPL